MKREQWFRRFKQFYIILCVLVFSANCSKQEFKKLDFQGSSSGVGSRAVPGKVDILLVVDNSASVARADRQLQAQFSGFIENLSNQFWDYHVARVLIAPPNQGGAGTDEEDIDEQLATDENALYEQVFSRILVNPNYNSPTLPDGSTNPNRDLVPTQYAVSNASQFPILQDFEINSSNGQIESGFARAYNALLRAKPDSILNPDNARHFFREDAVLAVILISNGVDATVHNFQSVQDNINEASPATPVKQLSSGTFLEDSVQGWATLFKSLKADPERQLRFYPIVSPSARPRIANDFCLVPNGTALAGTGYSMITNFIGGFFSDFCNEASLSNVLSLVQQDIKVLMEPYITSYIVLNYAPDLSSMRVYKNGNLLSQDASAGWTFVDCDIEVPTVTAIRRQDGSEEEFLANFQSGCAIQLNGRARLEGDDTYDIQFQRP